MRIAMLIAAFLTVSACSDQREDAEEREQPIVMPSIY